MTQTAWHTASEIVLSYKSRVKVSERPKITSSKETADLLLQIWDDDKIDFVEQFKILLLNQASRVLGFYDIATGGTSGVVADPKMIFAAAIKANAPRIIISHNHPSGDVTPSVSDQIITRNIKQGGLLFEIHLVDHIIVSSEGYYSFADEGLL